MPTTVYDSSLITKRRQMKAESGNFINRIQNPVQPTTGYAPALGIWDQSIINDVKNGQMVYYRKGTGGSTTIDNGCPCQPFPDTVHSLRVPSAPTIIQIIPGDGQLSIVFTAPSTDGGSSITDHQYSLDGENWQSVGSTTASYVIPGLTNGRSYMIRKRSMNAMGVGSISAAVVATPGVPSAPTNTIVTPGNGQVSVAFTAPSNNGSPITNYACVLTPLTGSPIVQIGTSSPLIVTGLTNGVSYRFSLQANNAYGIGVAAYGTQRGGAVAMVIPGSSTSPTNLVVTPGDGQVSIAFTPVLDTYNYRCIISPPSGEVFVRDFYQASPVVVSGLTNGVSYSFQLQASNIYGPGFPSESVVATPVSLLPSDAPTNFIVTPGDGQVSVAFTPPFQGAPFQDYQYSLVPYPDGTYIWISAGTTTSPFTSPLLASGTLYSIQVRAINTYGTGLASEFVQIYIEV